MSLSAVQSAENAIQMTAMADGASGQGNCDGCGGDDGKMGATCSPVFNCAGMAAMLPVERRLEIPRAAAVFLLVSSVASGLTAPPDPAPPRSRNLA